MDLIESKSHQIKCIVTYVVIRACYDNHNFFGQLNGRQAIFNHIAVLLDPRRWSGMVFKTSQEFPTASLDITDSSLSAIFTCRLLAASPS